MKDSATPGYSGTPLAKKLGIREGTRVLPLESPPGYPALLGALPRGASCVSRVGPDVDIAHVFAVRKTVLVRYLARLRRELR